MAAAAADLPSAERILVCVPTYNEAAHVSTIVARLEALRRPLDILFIDDDSPDGTGRLLDAIAADHKDVRVRHRPRKLGIGSAHLDGIRWAYAQGYRTLITMDCDFSHTPELIPAFVEAVGDRAVIVGSRYVTPGALPGWSVFRKVLTFLGHRLTVVLLGMPYDATGAFRLYRLDRVPAALFERVTSMGYAFFFESLYILHRHNVSIGEVPIQLPARSAGNSKMSFIEIVRSLLKLVALYRIARRARTRA